jgi:hypothetical protein
LDEKHIPEFNHAMPNREEVATIIVNGRRFEDWESVWVQHRWTETYPLFRFTCAEREPVPDRWLMVRRVDSTLPRRANVGAFL